MSYSALSPSARLVFCLIGSARLALLGSVGSAVFSFVGWVGSAAISLPWVVDSAAAAVEEESAAHARSWTKGQVARCQLCCRRRRQLQLLHDRCDGRWDDYYGYYGLRWRMAGGLLLVDFRLVEKKPLHIELRRRPGPLTYKIPLVYCE